MTGTAATAAPGRRLAILIARESGCHNVAFLLDCLSGRFKANAGACDANVPGELLTFP